MRSDGEMEAQRRGRVQGEKSADVVRNHLGKRRWLLNATTETAKFR